LFVAAKARGVFRSPVALIACRAEELPHRPGGDRDRLAQRSSADEDGRNPGAPTGRTSANASGPARSRDASRDGANGRARV